MFRIDHNDVTNLCDDVTHLCDNMTPIIVTMYTNRTMVVCFLHVQLPHPHPAVPAAAAA